MRATDPALNTDATPATRSFTVDVQAPNTTITSGPPVTSTDRTPTFAFSSTEQGGTFQCRLDNANFASCSSPKTYATQSRALHTFQVQAIDAAGNVDQTPAVWTFTITG